MSYRVPSYVRSVHNDGAVLLLNVHSGAYFALNPVGSLVWERLRAGGTRDAALAELRQRYRAPPERLARDVDALLERLVEKGLLARGEASAPPAPDSRPEAVPAPVPVSSEEARAPAQAPGRFSFFWRPVWFVLAYASMVCVDVLLRLRGFERFHETIRRWPVRSTRAEAADVTRIRAAVDEAAGYYFKRSWCLQRSAATVALLRLRGFPARLVIGVRRLPFAAHAWVELEGHIINDSPLLRLTFEVIERT